MRLEKLRPDRDLQCYFQRPSAIAALSDTGSAGFTVSGTWRQQFDWAVVDWNRENVFEHPALRNLPDGDLSGLKLTYEETRDNCIPLDSSLYPTVDWPYLRIWTDDRLYFVRLKDYATPVEGDFASAGCTFALGGAPTAGDYVELAWLDEHYTYQLYGGDSLSKAAEEMARSINRFSTTMTAEAAGNAVVLTWTTAGANGNRIGVYGNVAGARSETWTPGWQTLSGGRSPSKWRIELDFSKLGDMNGDPVPTTNVRKMRWTWAADLQAREFERSEFAVRISNWTVAGDRRGYAVAGPSSRRVEDDSPEVGLTGAWSEARGNFSGGSIRYCTIPGTAVSWEYLVPADHTLYLGTRKAASGATVTVQVDGAPAVTADLLLDEDVLVRIPVGRFSGGVRHRITASHAGAVGTYFYFDFFEAAVACAEAPEFEDDPQVTLATDWDTDHSIALAPERTAWLMHTLGFNGRANHYVGALWFYDLWRPGHCFASGSVRFEGTPEFGKTTSVSIGPTVLDHLNLIGDTAESVAKAFEMMINAGSTRVWASTSEGTLKITARAMGAEGNSIALAASASGTLAATVSGGSLDGGVDGEWRVDMKAVPRLNRAVRDWSRSYLAALKSYGIEATAAFSMELQHGDPNVEAGIAQRYRNGDPVWLNTPALQTNFSPESIAFWCQVYRDMADVFTDAECKPYLQFGEVQWWYFEKPYYDVYTQNEFTARYGKTMSSDPAAVPEETAFLASLIGEFTDEVMAFVREVHPTARFEVLYPPDVNEGSAVNLPRQSWTPAKLDCMKTENFTYTFARDLNRAGDSVRLPLDLGFPRNKASHLVGIGEYTTPWQEESRRARGAALESVVLFALDQFCLIGYGLPLRTGQRRTVYMG